MAKYLDESGVGALWGKVKEQCEGTGGGGAAGIEVNFVDVVESENVNLSGAAFGISDLVILQITATTVAGISSGTALFTAKTNKEALNTDSFIAPAYKITNFDITNIMLTVSASSNALVIRAGQDIEADTSIVLSRIFILM